MPHARRASVIIYCLGLAAIIVVLGYGFLRSTLNDTVAGGESHRMLLAESAARMGTARAIEAIVADHASATVTVNQGNGGSVTVPAVTFLDGAWRAPFVSEWRPNRLYRVDANQPGADNDVRTEDHMILPLLTDYDDWGAPRHEWYTKQGNQIFDGRGRYIEPGYHNVSTPAPAGNLSKPVEPTKYLDFAAAAPERDEALYLDHDFHRIDTGVSADDRVAARFRLRFAVGVEDLGGHILTNPHPDGDHDWRNPAADFRVPPPWLGAAQHAFYTMARSQVSPTVTSALRWEHVFLGRGNASNIDRRPVTGGPMTFPMMFRYAGLNASGNPDFWGLFSATPEPTGLRRPAEELYPIASPGGGEPLPRAATVSTPIIAHNYGPQMSWVDQRYAIQGYLGDDTDAARSHQQGASVQATMLSTTPFGRRLRKSDKPAGDWRWYEGRVETPFYVNLLTATPRTIHAMIVAYLPPAAKKIEMVKETFSVYKGKNPINDRDMWDDPIATNTLASGSGHPVTVGGRDLFTTISSPAFTYAPPSADGITPNYQRPDARGDDQRYPGSLWNLNDDLGKDIPVDRDLIGACSHTNLPFLFNFWAEKTILQKDGGWLTTPPAGWGTDPMDRVIIKPDEDAVDRYWYTNSYWWDIVIAFTETIGLARAAWVQYPTGTCNPYISMDPVLHDPAAFDTLEEIDRWFLAKLGEDFDAPGSGAIPPSFFFKNDSGKSQEYRTSGAATVSISSLRTAAKLTPDQANVMERVLNDWRLSFLGAGPQYSETFRPKDFSGDGKVHCSAYPKHGTATATQEAEGTAWWTAADGTGNGPAVTEWFSLSGCFYIGKSRYFRVFSRGEVWDNLSRTMVSGQLLESVVCVDPNGDDPERVETLYQRRHFDPNVSTLPRRRD